MKQFNIPRLGDIVTLSKDFTFSLVSEKRNITLFQKLFNKRKPDVSFGEWHLYNWEENYYNSYKIKESQEYWIAKTNLVTIPKETQLKVDRIYIRKGAKDFDSITFRIPSGKLKGSRFFIKFEDLKNLYYK